MALAAGATFAGYTIERTLGSGAAATVYCAQHPRFPRRDALKVLAGAAPADHEFRERFLRVAAAAAALRHPHIVAVHDCGECDGLLWAAMDYVSGTDAGRLVRDRYPGGLPVGEVLAVATAVAAALDHAHQRGFVHGAVKPANILIDDSEPAERRILLADFGISFPDPLAADGYTAPERLAGHGFDARADQYALAATACYLLTGVSPGTTTRLGDRRPELACLADVLERALAADPGDRFSRCGEFADALAARAAAAGIVDHPVTRSGSHPPGRRRRWLLGSSAAVITVLAVSAAIGLRFARHDAAEPAQPAAAPATTVSASSSNRSAALDGTYQIRIERSRQTFDDTPAPQPPDVTTWWAFQSTCGAGGCVAAGVLLDDTDHGRASPTAGEPLVLDFAAGTWESRPQTVRFACVGPDGKAGNETTTQVLSLQPQATGRLRGAMIVTVETDECGQQGGRITIPAAAARVGEVPAAVTVPTPPAAGR